MYVIAKLRLAGDTRRIETKTGARMESAFGFIDVDSESGLPCAVVAFGNLAEELSKYGKSASIRVSGIFKSNAYTNKQGEQVTSWQIVADAVAGIKSARGKYSQPKPKPEANRASSEFQDSAIPDSF